MPPITLQGPSSIQYCMLHKNLRIKGQVLLPRVCRAFLWESDPSSAADSEEHILESGEGTVKFASRWLLKQLKVHLHSHLDCKCIHKKNWGFIQKGVGIF